MRIDISKGDIIITEYGNYEIYGKSDEYNIVVKSDATIVLESLEINTIGKYKAAMVVENLSKVNLVLRGNSSLCSDDNYAGIEVIGKNDIEINSEESTCSIKIISGASSAGIGVGNGYDFEANITIRNGIIDIISTRDGAGIGGGNGGNGGGDFLGNLNIYGGIINIILGNGGGSGIGGGSYGSLKGAVNIYGGSISCLVEDYGLGAGIGGGYDGNLDGNVIINDGIVFAQGGEGSAGIGGGIKTKNGGLLSGDVVINGGNVVAYGGAYGSEDGGAGIGGGYGGDFDGNIYLNKGDITAYGPGNANDIGSGSNGQNNGDINIKVKEIVVVPNHVELKKGEHINLHTSVIIEAEINANIPDYQKVIYTSKDNNIAVVSEDGVVTATGDGHTEIIVNSVVDKNKSTNCYINVNDDIDIIGEIDMIISVPKNKIPYSELNNIVCYGNNPTISYKYLHDDIENINTTINVSQCNKDVIAKVNYKSVLVFLSINYSIALYSNNNLAIYALEFNDFSTNINFCASISDVIDIENYEILIMPYYDIDEEYSTKYYVFKINGYIGMKKM